MGIKLTTIEVIGTGYTGRCKLKSPDTQISQSDLIILSIQKSHFYKATASVMIKWP